MLSALARRGKHRPAWREASFRRHRRMRRLPRPPGRHASRACRSTPQAGRQTQAPARSPSQPPPQPPAGPPAVSRSSAPASISSASTSSSPTSNGNPVGDLKPEDFEVIEHGKPQTIETLQARQLDGGADATVEGAAPRDPHRRRRGDLKRRAMTCGCSRSSSTTITSAAEPACGAQAARAVRRDAARPVATWSA